MISEVVLVQDFDLLAGLLYTLTLEEPLNHQNNQLTDSFVFIGVLFDAVGRRVSPDGIVAAAQVHDRVATAAFGNQPIILSRRWWGGQRFVHLPEPTEPHFPIGVPVKLTPVGVEQEELLLDDGNRLSGIVQ